MAVKVADAFIAVGADLTGYRKGLGDAKKETQSLASQLRAAFRDPASFGGPSKAAAFIADLKLGRNLTASMRDAVQGLGGTLKGLSVAGLHSGLNGIKNVLGALKGGFSNLLKGIGIGGGIASFQALGHAIGDIVGFIPSLIDRARDYVLTVRTIQVSTGSTVEESSRFAATLDYLGGRTTKLSNLFAQMSRNLDTARAQLNELGVVTHKSNGAVLSQIQILDNARHAFQQYGDGTAKADAIARAFGEEGLATFIEYLRLTDDQLRIVAEDAERSGKIISAAQIKTALATERESNRIQEALTGIGVALLTTVGPQISSFLSHLTGVIQENMAAISAAISETVSFILGLVGSLVGAGDGVTSFSSSLLGASKAVSPYGADLASLHSQLADVETKSGDAADGTDGLRKSIQAQTKVVERQIEVLKRQEAAEDTLFKRTIRNLAQIYQARLDNLELAERERENLRRQQDLNVQLNEAQLELVEAQRGKAKGAGIEVDADAVSDAMARVADIQREQEELLRTNLVNGQREALESTRDYIESIGELLEKADNKRAALNTLRRREDVLNARQAAQLAAGDTEGAADTAARIEAIKTAEARAEQQIRNGDQESALNKQKEMLQEELSNVRSTATQTTAVRKAEIQKQIADLELLDAQWKKDQETAEAYLSGITGGFAGEGGLTQAMEEARLKGIEFGDSLKEAIGGLADLFAGLFGWIGKIKDAFDDIAESEVWKFLTKPVDLVPGLTNPKPVSEGVQPGLVDRLAELLGAPPVNPPRSSGWQSPDRERALGGPVNEGWWYLHNREQVLAPNVSDMLAKVLSGQLTPALAMTGGSNEMIELHSHLHLDGREIAEYVDRWQAGRRGR